MPCEFDCRDVPNSLSSFYSVAWAQGITEPGSSGSGLFLDGRLFPFMFGEPLVGLAAIANLGMGVPYFIAKGLALGKGVVTASSYEYGNTFLIVSGLLNMLVAIDAYDVRLGRK